MGAAARYNPGMMIPIPTDREAQREIVKAAREYADTLLKSPLKEIGGLLADQIGHWRQMNQVRCIFNAKKYMEEKGVEPTKMLPNVFVPLIEEAGNTDDETLSEMFARLMAAHLDENQTDTVHPSFTKVAGQLSPLDFQIMRIIDLRESAEWERLQRAAAGRPRTSPDDIYDEVHKQGHQIKRGMIDRCLDNLDRLRLIRAHAADAFTGSFVWLTLTTFGGRLLEAGSDPKTRWRAQGEETKFMDDSPERSLQQIRRELRSLKESMPNLFVAQ